MVIGRRPVTAFLCAIAAASALSAQAPKNLTARELFYAPVSPDAPAKPHPPRHATKANSPRAAIKAPSATSDSAAQTESAQTLSPAIPLVNAAYGGAKPLGLRYGFLRKGAAEDYEEVNADSVFHAGDRIRFSVQTNDAAYLYIVMRGSSGAWKVLFPTSEIEGGSNRVQGGRTYFFPPPPGRFAFDEQKGEEKLCLVLTRHPEESLEQLIYDLSASSPAAQPASDKTPKATLLAVNRPIEDGLVDRLRAKVYARDLVFEKVDESTPGDKKEKAAYVVNSNASPDARLVVDLALKHE